MWTQIVGKVRLALTPWTNHSWHVTLYLTARGLTTSPIPFGARVFQIDFDFVDHVLRIQVGGTCFRTSQNSGGSDAAEESGTGGSTSLRATEKISSLRRNPSPSFTTK